MGKPVLGSIAGVIVLLVVLSGCGGGSETLTKAEFVRKGETICGRMQSEREETNANFFKAHPNASVAQREALLVGTMGYYEKAIDQIGELTPPAGDEKKVEAIVAAMEEAVEIIKTDPGTILTHSAIGFGKANSQLEGYGIKLCSI